MYQQQQVIALVRIKLNESDSKKFEQQIEKYLKQYLKGHENQTIIQIIIQKLVGDKKYRKKSENDINVYYKFIDFNQEETQKLKTQIILGKQNIEIEWVSKNLLVKHPKISQTDIKQIIPQLVKKQSQHSKYFQYIAFNQKLENQKQTYLKLLGIQGIIMKFLTQKQHQEDNYVSKMQRSQIYQSNQNFLLKMSQRINKCYQSVKKCRTISPKLQQSQNSIKLLIKTKKRQGIKVIDRFKQIYFQVSQFSQQLSRIIIDESSERSSTQQSYQQKQMINNMRKFLSWQVQINDYFYKIFGQPQKLYDQKQLLRKLDLKSSGICAGISQLQIILYKVNSWDIDQRRELIRQPYIHCIKKQTSEYEQQKLKDICVKLLELQKISQNLSFFYTKQFSVQQFIEALNQQLILLLCLQNQKDKLNSHDIVLLKKQRRYFMSNCNFFTLQEVTLHQLKLYLRIWKNGPIYRKIRLKNLKAEQKNHNIAQQILKIINEISNIPIKDIQLHSLSSSQSSEL